MIFQSKKHNEDLYNILLTLSRNIFFYKKIGLSDNFETRIYLMFIHFSIMMIVFKKKGTKFSQSLYDRLFHNIENNLRELGFGDVSVNKKMKELNKILYDILLKLEVINHNNKNFEINHNLLLKYFAKLNDQKNEEFLEFKSYFNDFYNFCFELPLDNMLSKAINFKI
jgi:cytochrome b pre-mRNA-processing protein 3